MTVGDIRKAMANLPDDAPLAVEWHGGPPSDSEPGVAIHGFEARRDENGTPYLAALVGLFYLDDDPEDGKDSDDRADPNVPAVDLGEGG